MGRAKRWFIYRHFPFSCKYYVTSNGKLIYYPSVCSMRGEEAVAYCKAILSDISRQSEENFETLVKITGFWNELRTFELPSTRQSLWSMEGYVKLCSRQVATLIFTYGNYLVRILLQAMINLIHYVIRRLKVNLQERRKPAIVLSQ